MNRQVNPDHCYDTEDGMYMLVPVHGTPEWRVTKDGRNHRTFTSLMAAKGWLEHVLEHGEQTTADEEDEESDERMDRGDWEFHRDHDQ